MKTLIAVDGNGCHYRMIEISDRRYNRLKYMDALYNSIEMNFKKLKYHKGKMDITITEVEDGKPNKGKKQRRAKAVLENDAPGAEAPLGPEALPADGLTDKLGD